MREDRTPRLSGELSRWSGSCSDLVAYRAVMSGEPPFAHLPDEISLTREELAVVLFALDIVEEVAVDTADAATVRRAIRVLTAKLWPELGDLLGDDQE